MSKNTIKDEDVMAIIGVKNGGKPSEGLLQKARLNYDGDVVDKIRTVIYSVNDGLNICLCEHDTKNYKDKFDNNYYIKL